MTEDHILIINGMVGSELTALSFNNYVLSAISHGPDHNPEFQWTWLKFLVATFRETHIRELKKPPRRRQQKPHKCAYFTWKNSILARFARAFFIIFRCFEDVLVLSTTWVDLFCSCLDDVSVWWQMFHFVFLSLKRWFQFNSSIVRTHFANIMTMNN